MINEKSESRAYCRRLRCRKVSDFQAINASFDVLVLLGYAKTAVSYVNHSLGVRLAFTDYCTLRILACALQSMYLLP